MSANVQAVVFVVMLVAAVIAVLAGSVVVQARWRKTLATPPITGDPEPRSVRTVDYRRPAKITRPRDCYDHADVAGGTPRRYDMIAGKVLRSTEDVDR